MLFNSITFALFFIIVFLLYWFVFNRSLKKQNILLLVASYTFYAWWDWRFLSLIIISSVVDYLVSLEIDRSVGYGRRKGLLYLSLLTNLGILFSFKYFNFFVDSFVDSMALLGFNVSAPRLNIVLPVGISFYTFQTLSYTIDVYRKKLNAQKNVVAFFTYVAFFPQLVAGPIERAAHLLPQFLRKRKVDYLDLSDGFGQVVWGLFKKMVIADNCALIVNQVYANYEVYSASTLVLAAVLFSFQIYGDFSGYSDIAIGIAKMLGFKLKQNFAYPYFSRDLGEFWRRWHMSLTSWFRDYVYIPLGGSRGGTWNSIRNTFIVFVISGFWHGANWTFIVWGGVNALFFIPLFLAGKNRRYTEDISSTSWSLRLKEIAQILVTFAFVTLTWVFFRSDSITGAFDYFGNMFCLDTLFTIPYVFGIGVERSIFILLLVGFCVLVEWFNRKKKYALELLDMNYSSFFWLKCFSIAILIFLFKGTSQDFIYFQF